MSKEVDNLRRKLARRMAEAGSNSSYGTVKEVNEEKRTCDVEVGGIIREGVLLYALEDPEKKGWFFVPAVDSVVQVSRIDTGTRLRVSMFSVIDKVICTIGEKMELMIDEKGAVIRADKTTLSAKDSGFILTRGTSGLLKTLSALCDAISKLTVSTLLGPSSVPINSAEFVKIKQDLNNYLEG